MIDPSLVARSAAATILTGHFTQGLDYRHRRDRGSADWLIFATVEGAGFLASGATRFILPAGHLACYPPGTPQDYGTDPVTGNWDFYWAHVDPRPTWLEWLSWSEAGSGLRHLVIEDQNLVTPVHAALAAMHHDALSPLATGEELARNALERALLLAHLANPAAADGALDQRVRATLAYMGNNLHRPLSLAGIAAHCDSSPSRLAHLFRQQVGTPPVRFHEQQRLQRAAELLRATELPIQAVAEEVGFDDAFYFSNRFRRHCGHSPSAWRKLGG